MLKIRLQRIGRRNSPEFRVVVTDSQHGPKSGKFIEVIGSYTPKPGTVQFDTDRVKHWLSVGAQPSDTVFNFLVDQKLVEAKKKNVLPKKSPTKKRKAPEEEPAPAEPADAPAEETPTEAPAEETPAEDKPAEEVPAAEETKDDAPAEEAVPESTEEKPAE